MFEGTIPEAISLSVNNEKWTFAHWVQWVCDMSPVFETSRAAGRAGDRLVNAVIGKSPGDEFTWLDDDHKLFDEAVESPPKGWCPPLARIVNGIEEPVVVPARMFNRYFDAASRKEPTAEGVAQ